MRKLILQMNTSADGFVADSHRQIDWMLPEEDPEHIKYLNELTQNTDLLAMGKNMALESIPYWQKMADENNADQPEFDFAQFFVNTPKIVFSKTLRSLPCKNVSIENRELVEIINNIKQSPGKNIMVYGGASFAASLINEKLLDEINLFVHPVAIGSGLAIFKERIRLYLLESQSFSNGIVMLKYGF